MIVAVAAALVIVLAVQSFGPPGEKLGAALRATARWSFLWFCLATTGSALTSLFGANFQWLAQRGRDFGLAFASAHLVHLTLVARLLYVSAGPFPRPQLIFFGLGVVWTYLLALLSVSGSLRATLSPKAWRTIRTIGVEYIAFAFLSEFAGRAFHGGVASFLIYLPFLTLALAGPLLRIAALGKRWRAALAEERLKPGHAA